jgi:hypothetical protein
MKTSARPLFTLLAFASCLPLRSKGDTIYFNDFEGSVRTEWSSQITDSTPVGSRRFLGQFGNSAVTLSLANLPVHSSVILSFDLFIINSWQGNDPDGGYGPDFWDLRVVDGPQLLRTTFSYGSGHRQAFPDNFPSGDYPAETGATEIDTLGYPLGGDNVYHLQFTFAHTSNTVGFSFRGSNLEDLGNESWGLDNVNVASNTPDAVSTLSALGALFAGFAALRRRFGRGRL